jgi:hypothetical protein
LGERNHAVVAAQIFVEHIEWTCATPSSFRTPAISARCRPLSVRNRAQAAVK